MNASKKDLSYGVTCEDGIPNDATAWFLLQHVTEWISWSNTLINADIALLFPHTDQWTIRKWPVGVGATPHCNSISIFGCTDAFMEFYRIITAKQHSSNMSTDCCISGSYGAPVVVTSNASAGVAVPAFEVRPLNQAFKTLHCSHIDRLHYLWFGVVKSYKQVWYSVHDLQILSARTKCLHIKSKTHVHNVHTKSSELADLLCDMTAPYNWSHIDWT